MKFTDKAGAAVLRSANLAKKYGHAYTGTEHLLLALTDEASGPSAQILAQHNVTGEALLKLIHELIAPEDVEIKHGGQSMMLRQVLDKASEIALQQGFDRIGTTHLLIAVLFEQGCAAYRLLNSLGIKTQQLYEELLKEVGIDPAEHKDDLKNQGASGSLTPTLDQFSKDLTKEASFGRLDPIIGREEEMQRLMQVISRRTKNNPCLIGEPGVGKTAIMEGLAQRIAKGEVPQQLQHKRLVSLEMSSMVAGTKYRGEFEERMKTILSEVKRAGNILLFIDEIHTMIGAGGAEGALDASNIMKPSLSRGEIQVIGATTIDEYRKHIEKDAALERRFQPITVEEPTEMQTVEILSGLKEVLQQHHQVEITQDAIEAAVAMSQRYINDRFLPDKAIDVLDEACSKRRLTTYSVKETQIEEARVKALSEEFETALQEARFEDASQLKKQLHEAKEAFEKELKKQKRRNARRLVVSEKDIADIISAWSGVPVTRITQAETKQLVNLEKTLHKRMIGQDEAISAVSRAVKRGRVGLKDPQRPIGSFLFLGPTGVGKTELSKTLAQALFGKEDAMIRVDMTEYMEKHSVSKMIGSPPGYVGYDEGGQLSEQVRRNPYSVILFDEIEKAHPDVFNILLQVLDDGHITDAQGRKVDFKNTVIIMTSNAGAQHIITPKALGFGAQSDEKQNYERMKRSVMEEVGRLFKPEFLNRIDETIVFHSLNQKELKQIVSLQLDILCKRVLDQMQMKLIVRDSVKKHIVETGSDEKYGARPIKRAIQKQIEDPLAEEILSGRIGAGDVVTVTMRKKEIVFLREECDNNK